ncbi:serine/threonine-protein phosphatase 6 regulatory ankyrin repeat subunit A-like [Haliotis rufescens]|uniref:serine/threonine-protein phosphatase 6 regulatory ankyrin repeat subunit A-like n=1 Tax=Haliotis rufescens TaxID=6454 RepID=UPI00201F6090|nr:serine/threonine-protein phosphatase 6 regulatory ankyrin repeat subunit A-like [Haliotis rufescens]
MNNTVVKGKQHDVDGVVTEDVQIADNLEEEEGETDENDEEGGNVTLGAATFSKVVLETGQRQNSHSIHDALKTLTHHIATQGSSTCQDSSMALMPSQSNTQEMDTNWVPETAPSSGAASTIQYNVLQVQQHIGEMTVKGGRNLTIGGTQNIGKSQPCPQEEEEEEKPLTTVQKIRKRTESRIQSWTQGMVKTQAHKEVMEKIDRGATWVTIKGRPGEGKSTVAYMALRDLHSQGRQVYQVVSPEEFNEVTRTCTNPVIMMDDIFGDLEFDVAEWTKWRPSLRPILDLQNPDLELTLNGSTDINPEQNRKKQSLFILVGRDYVLKSSLPDLGRAREYVTSSKHLVELSPTTDHIEKLNILKSIFQMEGVDIEKKVIFKLSHIACPHGFPHVCRLFATAFKQNDKVSAKEFFVSPLEFLNQTLQKLINNKSKCQLLKAMIQGDGKVSQSELYKDKYKMHDCVSSANELVGSYLKLEDGTYMFDHPSIYDSVAFLLTEKDPVFVIENSSLSFINQRLRHGTVETQGLVAEIPPFCIDNLVQRFALAIQRGNLAYVISHQICCDPDFIDKLMNILKEQYQISVNTFLRKTDEETLESCLELLPSNKCSTMVKYILEKGNITLHQTEIDEILFGVYKHAAGDVLTYLTKHLKLDINATYRHREQTPLMIATETGDCNFVHQILRLLPDLNASDSYDRTVLHYLCEHGLVSAVEYVIDKGVDIDVPDQMGQSSLFLACLSGHKGLVKLLLDRGAVGYVDNYHKSPLLAACLNGKEEVVKLVLDRTDVNCELKDRSLGWACACGIEGIVKALLEGGANIAGRDIHFKPLYQACTHGHANIVKTLLVAGAELSGDEVCAACKSGNLDVVEMLFDKGASVNMISKDGQLPLHAACESGKMDVVRVVTGKGANVSMVAPNGNTTLHSACKGGSQEVVLFLLEKLYTSHEEDEREVGESAEGFRKQKADNNSNIKSRDNPAAAARVNIEDNTGNTALHVASIHGSKECVDMLLKAGADVKVQNETADTPLHDASRCGSEKCVDLLLKAGADVKVQNNSSYTALHRASIHASNECVDLLLKAGADVQAQNRRGFTPLHIASMFGSQKCVDMLLKAGADVKVQNETGDTPLHTALRYGSQKCVDLLLKAGADVKVKNETGDTPLHNASRYGSEKCVDLLLKAGADVKVQNETGDTPLHNASMFGSQKCVDLLLKAGADVKVQNDSGCTALHAASMCGSQKSVYLLLKAGADVRVQNNSGYTALHAASMYGSKDCVDLLLKAGADIQVQNRTGDTPLHVASMCRSQNCVDMLLKAGADVKVQNETGDTPLHEASRCGSEKCVDLLLKAGADVKVQNETGDTPLLEASRCGSEKCVDLILKAWADVKVQNKSGCSALHATSMCGSEKCVDLLLKAGADVKVQNETSDTPLHEASRCGSEKCVDL